MLLHRFLSTVYLVRLCVKKYHKYHILILYGMGILCACEDPSPQATLEGMRDRGLAMIVNTNEVDDRSLVTDINIDYNQQISLVDLSIDAFFARDFMSSGTCWL